MKNSWSVGVYCTMEVVYQKEKECVCGKCSDKIMDRKGMMSSVSHSFVWRHC